MSIVLAPAALDKATRESWDFMFNGPGRLGPLDGKEFEYRVFDFWNLHHPEAIGAHKATVFATIDADFDLERSVRSSTKGRQGANDLTERAKIFRLRLIAYLQAWCKKEGL